MILLLSILLLFGTACQGQSSSPIVSTPLGKIRGHHKVSFGQRNFSAFEGIPYAQSNRFEESKPIDPWTGTWNATSLYECSQIIISPNDSKIFGDEDCLYVNVYVPRDHPNPSEKLDVIVHIHGGGFMFGSGHFYAHPEYLMDKDVVFVTFNYRLGVFGFLSTEDSVVPGNNGLKDQVLALKWVKNNIASFGGNCDSVTLTGASSGGASVHLHYLSPMSRGLFHRGVSQSGCALNPWTMLRKPLADAKVVGTALGCPKSPNTALVNCLKLKPHREILGKVTLLQPYMFFPVVLFGPVVEKAPNAFLDKEPAELLATGRVQNLPWIVSTVPHEGTVSVFENDMERVNRDWEKMAPFVLRYDEFIPKEMWKDVAKKIREFYLGKNHNFTTENYDKLVQIITDGHFVAGVVKSIQLQATVTNASVYYYRLSYTGDSKKRVEHADDIQYFFYDREGRQPTQNELKMKDIMVDMWVSYAKTSKPKIDGVVWRPAKRNQINFLEVSGFQRDKIHLETKDNLEVEHFWQSLGFPGNDN